MNQLLQSNLNLVASSRQIVKGFKSTETSLLIQTEPELQKKPQTLSYRNLVSTLSND